MIHPGSPPPEMGSSKLFIGGLSYDTTDGSLAHYFSSYGEVSSAVVLRDPVTAHSRGFGFVTFREEVSAQRVLAHSRNHFVDGRKVEAKIAVPRNQTAPKKTGPMFNPLEQQALRGNFGMNGMGNLGGMNMQGLGMQMGLNEPYDAYMNGMNSFGHPSHNMGNPGGMNYDLNQHNSLYGAPLGLHPQDMYQMGHHPLDRNLNQQQDHSLFRENSTASSSGPPGQVTRFDDRLNSVIYNEEDPNGVGGELERSISPNNASSNRRPTYPQLGVPLSVSPSSRLRKLSMPPSKLAALGGLSDLDNVTDSLGSLNIESSANNHKGTSLWVSRLSPASTVDSVKEVFQNFGAVEKVEMMSPPDNSDEKQSALVTFKDTKGKEEALKFEQTPNGLLIDGQRVTVQSFFHNENTLLGGQNLSYDQSVDTLNGLTGSRRLKSQFPMMRANSVSQSMLTSRVFDNPEEDFVLSELPSLSLLRDEKSRSFSVTASMKPRPVQRIKSGTYRRSSSFFPTDNPDSGDLGKSSFNSLFEH